MSKLGEQLCKTIAKQIIQARNNPNLDGYELYEDLKSFLQLARGSGTGAGDWPFTETLIFGTIPGSYTTTA